MCIAIPALVTSVNGNEAVAEIDGEPRLINAFLTPEAEIGDYVLLCNGYAMEVYTGQEAAGIFVFLDEIS